MIKVNNIFKNYDDKVILKNVNFICKEGKIYALVGSNGTGKTTLMNIITGSIQCDSGDVFINDINTKEHKSRYNLFFVPDDKEMFTSLTGLEYISFILNIYNVKIEMIQSKLQALLSAFKMNDDINKLISNYSLGMKQKIYVVAALLSGANNIMLDEPFNCLDPEMSRILKDQISIAIKEGKTVLYSTHNLDTVSRFCDEVIILGKNHEVYPVTNMENVNKLEKLFFEKCI